MKTIQLLCITLVLALTLTACVGQTALPTETVTTTSSTDTTSTTADNETADTFGTTPQETSQASAQDSTTVSTDTSISRSIQDTTTTTKANQTTAVTTKVTTTTAKTTTKTTRSTTTTTGNTVTVAQYESEVLRLVNIERAAQGLAALSAGSSAAMQAAAVRAAEIKTSFSHTRPNGSSCFTALEEAGVPYRAAGENIASGYRTPSAVVEGWMNSDGHLTNILSKNFTHLAVGYDDNNWVQLFYTPHT